jgi:hypothetical protein
VFAEKIGDHRAIINALGLILSSFATTPGAHQLYAMLVDLIMPLSLSVASDVD